MAIHKFAGGFARNTASLWKAVAEAVDPTPPTASPDPVIRSGSASPVDPITVDGVAENVGVADGQMLVPIDTWTRILEQVGNVHEAGQQLADAKERAARAETENQFLKEQLRDIKSQRRPTRRPAAPAVPEPAAHEDESLPTAATTPTAQRLARARRRASRWLSPE